MSRPFASTPATPAIVSQIVVIEAVAKRAWIEHPQHRGELIQRLRAVADTFEKELVDAQLAHQEKGA